MPQETLAPGLLVAAPGLEDPNFHQALVLMLEHGEGGALGFIVNRPAPVTLDQLLTSVDDFLAEAARESGVEGTVLWGGPVQPEALWLLFPRLPEAEEEEEVVPVGERHGLAASREILAALVQGVRPGPFYLILGYAGWSPMQVEQETAAGTWLPLDLAEDIVFEVPFDDRWDEAVRRAGLTPGGFIIGGPGAQA